MNSFFFLFPFHANKHDLCPILFLSTGKMFAPKQNTNLWGQTKIKILLPTSKNSMITNRESQWQQLFLLLAVLTMFKKFLVKYSSAARGAGLFMCICSPAWMRVCNWKRLCFLPQVQSFFPHLFKSSNLTKETDTRSPLRANDCLLMF